MQQRKKKYYLLNVDKVSAYRCIQQKYSQNILSGAELCAFHFFFFYKNMQMISKNIEKSKRTSFYGKRKMF